MKFVTFMLATVSVLAQDTVVKITGKGPRTSTSTVQVNYKNALVSYALGNGVIDANGVATLNLMIANRTGQLPAGLQFELSYSPGEVTGLAVSVGPAAVAANKTVTCAPQSATVLKCIIVGTSNNTGIRDGIVAVVAVQTSLTSQSNTTVMAFGTVSASASGSSIMSIVIPGGGIVSMPALLAGFTCDPMDIWNGSSITCTVSLNKPAPPEHVSIVLSSDHPELLGLPGMVTVPSGSTSAQVVIVGN